MQTSSLSLDIDLGSAPKARGNLLLEDLDRLREHEAVFWSEASGCWIVTRHQDVADVYLGRKPLDNAGLIEANCLGAIPEADRATRIPHLLKSVRLNIISTDGPDHSRLRKLLMNAFSRKVVEGVRTYAQTRIAALLDDAARVGELDFQESVARALTGSVLFNLLGFPDSAFAQLRDWSNAVIEGVTVPGVPVSKLIAADRALGEMNALVLAELEKREKEPQNDLLTAMLQATDDGDRLTIDELLAQMHVIIIAGHDTTTNTMTLGIEALDRNPEGWKYMYDHPDEIAQCVGEIQRYTAMSGGPGRVVRSDFEWHGKFLKRGDIVLPSIIAANRDPAVFVNPERLDFSRDLGKSLVFAPGIHFCLGHMLTKMQLTEFFSAAVARFERIEVLEGEIDFMQGLTFRGLERLNVRFHPRAA